MTVRCRFLRGEIFGCGAPDESIELNSYQSHGAGARQCPIPVLETHKPKPAQLVVNTITRVQAITTETPTTTTTTTKVEIQTSCADRGHTSQLDGTES
jgi:hypothetical protein